MSHATSPGTPNTVNISGTGRTVARMDIIGAGDWVFNGDILGDGSLSELTGVDANGELNVATTGTVDFNGNSRFTGNITLDRGTTNVGAESSLKGERFLYVGEFGTGTLNLTDGGKATAASDITLGWNANSSGTVTVDGTGSELKNTGGVLNVGREGTGRLELTDGGKATSADAIYLGYYSNSEGTVTVGAGSTLSGTNIYVGGDVTTAGGTGFLGGTGTVTANAGAGTIRVYSTGTLSPGDTPGDIGTLTLGGNLDMRGATLAVDISSTASLDQLAVTGNVFFDGTVNTLAANFLGPVQLGKYTFLTTTAGNVTDPTGMFNVTLPNSSLDGYNLIARGSGVYREVDQKSLYLQLVLDNIALTWTGDESGLWTNNSATPNSGNWTNAPVTPLETKFRNGDSVTFSTGAPSSVVVADNVTVADMTVTGGMYYDFTGTGGITGSTTQSTGLTATGKLNVTGNSTVVFANSGTNSFGGGTDIGAGSIVQIGNVDATGSLGGAVVNNGTFDVTRSDAYTLDNTISGTGVTKMTGTGTMTISGTQTQANRFEQSKGTVNLLKTWIGDYTQIGGVLVGSGTIDGDLVSATDIRPGSDTTLGTLNVTGTADFTGTTLRFKVDGTSSDLIAVDGNVTLGTGADITTIDILNFTPNTAVTYTLLTGANNFWASQANFTTLVGGSAASGRQLITYDNSDLKAVKVTLSSLGNESLTWAGADGDLWRGSNKWTETSLNDETFLDGDTVTFTNLGTQTVAMGTSDVTVGNMTVTGGDYTFTGDGVGIRTTDTGTTGKLQITGGSVTLANTGTNSFGNGIEIALGASLQLGKDGNGGTLVGDIANSGTLNLDYAGTFGNSLTGSGALNINNDITINHANSGFTGATTLAADKALSLGDANALGSSTIANSGTLDLDYAGIFGNPLTGSGNLNINNNIAINHANSGFTGATTLAADKALSLGNANALQNSAVALGSGSTLALNQATTVGSLTANGATIDLGDPDNTLSAVSFAMTGNNTVQLDSATAGTYTLLASTNNVSAWNIDVFNMQTVRDSVKETQTTLDYKILAEGPADLVWNDKGSDWNSTDKNFSTSDGFDFTFQNLDNVTFGNSGNKIVNITGPVQAGDLNITGDGYRFNLNGGDADTPIIRADNLNAAGVGLTIALPEDLDANQTLIAVNAADIRNANLKVITPDNRPGLDIGEGVKLIAANRLEAGNATLTMQSGNGDVYHVEVSGNDLLVILDSFSPTSPIYERLKAFAEGRTSSVAFVRQGQDTVSDQGIRLAQGVTSRPGLQLAAFGDIGGGFSRYNTGSHVDVGGASMMVGFALGDDVPGGRLMLGMFAEGGWGNYDSHNSFSNSASVHGQGDTSFMGGGMLAGYKVTSGSLSDLYMDASVRMGHAETDFETNDITYNGIGADFDTTSLYFGLHGGLGYEWKLGESASLDFSTKLLWTRQEGDNLDVHGDRVHFDDTDSLRTRLGGRFSYAIREHVIPYAGAYWEREYAGEAYSTVNGNHIDAVSLQGDTGVGTLGLSFKPAKNSGFSIDLGVQGYAGKREGVSGNFQMKWEF